MKFLFLLRTSSAQQLFKEPLITEKRMHIQQNTEPSNNAMRRLGSVLNQICLVVLLEPNFHQKFAQAGKKLSDLFTVSSITLPQNNQKCKIVHCKSLSSISNVFLDSRKLTAINFEIED